MGPCTYFHHRRHINNIFSWSSSRWTKDPSTAVASPLSYHSELQLSLWISLFSYNNHSTSKCIIYFLSIFRHVVWRRQWQPTPVFLPGKSHGRRSLVGCSPWGRKESDTTERLHFHFSLSRIGEGNGNPLQCSCLENPRDGAAWWAAIYGVAQSRTRLKRLSGSKHVVGGGFSGLCILQLPPASLTGIILKCEVFYCLSVESSVTSVASDSATLCTVPARLLCP